MTPEQQIQKLLAEMVGIVDVMNDVAKQACIDRVEFMGGYFHFCTNGTPAASGPVFNQEYWSASSFGCWPSDEQRTWMYGPDRKDWPRTSYEDEDEWKGSGSPYC